MNAVASTLLVALALLAPGGATAQALPSAESLFARSQERLEGNGVELWKSSWSDQSLRYGLLRRRSQGRYQSFVHVLEPTAWREFAFLVEELADGRFRLTFHRSLKQLPAGSRASPIATLSGHGLIERLPYIVGLPTLADVRPLRAQDFTHELGAESRCQGLRCATVESVPREKTEEYGRIRTLVALESGLALETSFLKDGRSVRRIVVAPADVRTELGRALPTRRSISVPGEAEQVLELENLMVGVDLPDQLFTTRNLIARRFPSF